MPIVCKKFKEDTNNQKKILRSHLKIYVNILEQ